MRHALALLFVLGLLWAVLSGKFDHALLLWLGLASVAATVGLSARMGLFDQEAAPYYRLPFALPYWGWLGGEIAKANVAVARVVMAPDIELTPRLVKVDCAADTDLGRTVFANSITLTPGTVSVEVEPDAVLVHALLPEMADPAGYVEMNQGASKMAGRSTW